MKRNKTITVICACLLMVLVLGGIVLAVLSNGKRGHGNYISIITISGTIGDVKYDLFGDEVSLSASAICDYLDDIAYDDSNKGVFLNIESPGGSVYETDKIYQALMEYKEYTGRPIVASCHSTMCSGAYYIACAADRIYAERTATVGSIGVYIQMVDISKLCESLGISVDYIRSSENKAMGNMYNPMTEEQREIYQTMIDEDYERFVDIVMKARGYTDRAEFKNIADGRSYSAEQAVENGLIDKIMENDDVLYAFMDEVSAWSTDYPYVKHEGLISSFIGTIIDSLPVSESKLLEKLMNAEQGRAMYLAQ